MSKKKASKKTGETKAERQARLRARKPGEIKPPWKELKKNLPVETETKTETE